MDVVDGAIASMSRHDQPAEPELARRRAAAHAARHRPRSRRAATSCADYWEDGPRRTTRPFETGLKAGTAEVYLHEMPGGQYTNLQQQAEALGLGDRWHEIARAYAEVNQLFGDIVKVTPSCKVVGDMALFLVSQQT